MIPLHIVVQDFVPDGKLGVKDGVVVEQSSDEAYADSILKITTIGCIRRFHISFPIRPAWEGLASCRKTGCQVGEQILLVGTTVKIVWKYPLKKDDSKSRQESNTNEKSRCLFSRLPIKVTTLYRWQAGIIAVSGI